jgi:hypothetical protein
MDDTINDYLKAIGRRGGRTTARRGPGFYRELQRRSVQARRRNAARRTDPHGADAAKKGR